MTNITVPAAPGFYALQYYLDFDDYTKGDTVGAWIRVPIIAWQFDAEAEMPEPIAITPEGTREVFSPIDPKIVQYTAREYPDGTVCDGVSRFRSSGDWFGRATDTARERFEKMSAKSAAA